MLPAAPVDEVPPDTNTDPELEPLDTPEVMDIPPLEPLDPLSADLISNEPPTPDDELPEASVTEPPVCVALSPDFNTTLAPTEDPADPPAVTAIKPDTPLTAVPVCIFKPPELPALDLPEFNVTPPLLGEAAVARLIAPLVLASELPLVKTTEPPVD